MKWLIDLLSDGQNASIMRVMAFITCLVACVLAFRGPEYSGLVSVLITASFGAKVGQKFIEDRNRD